MVDDAYLNGYARLCGWKATLVYLSLCRHAAKDQSCFPGIKLMAEELSVSPDTIMDGVKALQQWNLVSVTKENRKNGTWKSNSYVLIDKSEWKSRPSVGSHTANSQRDYVANSKQPDGYQPVDQPVNNDTKDTQIEGNTDKVAETSSAEWTLETEIKKLEDNERRDLNIIALYWEYKQPIITNQQQAQKQIARSIRAAQELTPYEDARLVKTMKWLRDNATFKWTLESCLKYINEDPSKLNTR